MDQERQNLHKCLLIIITRSGGPMQEETQGEMIVRIGSTVSMVNLSPVQLVVVRLSLC